MPSSRLNNGEQTRVNYSEIGRCQGPQGFRKIGEPGLESPPMTDPLPCPGSIPAGTTDDRTRLAVVIATPVGGEMESCDSVT